MRAHEQEVKSAGILRLSQFGSVACGEAGGEPGNDVAGDCGERGSAKPDRVRRGLSEVYETPDRNPKRTQSVSTVTVPIAEWAKTNARNNAVVAVGDVGPAALALYEWNAQISGAFMAPLHICEVVIRNAVSDALTDVRNTRSRPWPERSCRAHLSNSHCESA